MQSIRPSCSEVGQLAQTYLDDPECWGLIGIENNILEATAASQWDEVGKWHRVRLRYLRLVRVQHRNDLRALTPNAIGLGSSAPAPRARLANPGPSAR